VLAGGDGEGDVVENGIVAAGYVDVLEREKRFHCYYRIDGAGVMENRNGDLRDKSGIRVEDVYWLACLLRM
jgi:hypothetical protein